MQQQLSTALEWRDGQPYSTHYEDVYFSTNPENPQQGLEETRYVFIAHNQLETRFSELKHAHFTIAETGFGTGLNFLCACQLWLKTAPQSARLHFISAERHPLTLQEMQQAHALWPNLASESSALLSHYSLLSAGFHRFSLFDNRVVLTLLIGDVNTLLPSLHAQVDAWFLDGFSPAKNPEMWQQSLFAQMARLSHQLTTFATFTSAGFVRRGLEAAGFTVLKDVGYGRKREMLFGRMAHDITLKTKTAGTAIVIGGGIAGCASAHALAERGWQVRLIERHANLAQEASGNPRGVLYPRLASHNTAQDRLSLSSYLYTLRLLKSLNLNEADFQACGLLQLAFNEREATRLLEVAKRDLGADLLRWLEREEASEIAGIHLQHAAMYFASAGWVNPQAFCHALTQHPNITLALNQNALTLTQKEAGWQVYIEQSLLAEADIVVIANANDALKLKQSAHLPITPVRGQMSSVAALGNSAALKAVVCTDGYLTPAQQGLHYLGATFSAQESSLEVREADNRSNLAMLGRMSPDLSALSQQAATGRAALRCATPDYLPMLGELLDIEKLQQNPPKHVSGNISLPTYTGLYVNVGHGSKGLITAPFCAEILASQICQEPLPIDAELVIAMNPNRYTLREMGLKRLISHCALTQIFH